ncbi:MAG: polyphosphate:AMP phosphotransferase [Deltaproteobacteria bacterium]|nr:polyphosphate:AMP phosphotransferase [Deltaproteobacteria bacterium]
MFETAETGASIGKEEYERRIPELRVELVNAQYDLREADFPVIVVVCGDDWLGVHEILTAVGEIMDGRFVALHAMGEASDEEGERPEFWRYWRRLPGAGEMAVFADEWSADALVRYLRERVDREGYERQLRRIARFEADLAQGGALVLKFWIHVPKKALKKRIKKAKKNRRMAWRIGAESQELYDGYTQVMEAARRLVEVTDEAESPWHLVEGSDRRTLRLSVFETLFAALRARLDRAPPEPPPPAAAPSQEPGNSSILHTVDLGARLEREEYKKRLAAGQTRLFELGEKAQKKGVTTALVFEGWDAAGKGGVIRRITRATDVRRTRVVAVGAPSPEEAAHHYLWRFWRQLPRKGHMVIFDRSWYGRVLVERVEGFAGEAEWRRAYREINDFEEQLTEAGMVVQKFWLHIDPAEQLARFRAREQTSYKKYKITEDDYRNRGKWAGYEQAVEEMVARTSTSHAPWHLIPANHKPYARVQVIETICAALEDRL